MTPSYDLRCPQCRRKQEMSEFPMIATATVTWAPNSPDGLRYITCKCGVTTQWEVAPTLTVEELLRWYHWLRRRHEARDQQVSSAA